SSSSLGSAGSVLVAPPPPAPADPVQDPEDPVQVPREPPPPPPAHSPLLHDSQLIRRLGFEESSLWLDNGQEGGGMKPLIGQLDESAGPAAGSSGYGSCRTDHTRLNQEHLDSTTGLGGGPAGDPELRHPRDPGVTHNESLEPSMTFHLPQQGVPSSLEGSGWSAVREEAESTGAVQRGAAWEKGILEQSDITLVSESDCSLGPEEREQDSTLLPGDDPVHPATYQKSPDGGLQAGPGRGLQAGPDMGLQEAFQRKRLALIQRSALRVEEIRAKRALTQTGQAKTPLIQSQSGPHSIQIQPEDLKRSKGRAPGQPVSSETKEAQVKTKVPVQTAPVQTAPVPASRTVGDPKGPPPGTVLLSSSLQAELGSFLQPILILGASLCFLLLLLFLRESCSGEDV
ncbi:hypothetical protein CRUP_036496, partial [Coryphaenoides rupestris]